MQIEISINRVKDTGMQKKDKFRKKEAESWKWKMEGKMKVTIQQA